MGHSRKYRFEMMTIISGYTLKGVQSESVSAAGLNTACPRCWCLMS